MKMTGGVLALAAATAATMWMCGCTSEAERFGYTGEDLVDQASSLYLVTPNAVTNWVPERVLSVVERYDLTADEESVVKAAGVPMPGATLKAMPEGYAKEQDEPWFAWWTHQTKAFGFSGVAGVLTHYDEDAAAYETGLCYFSSYWKTREEAEAALASLRAQLEAGYRVKKFHAIESGWIAEYVRLLVMGVVGQKADGSWSCMLNLRDKCNPGCGVWEPVEDQQERRDQYEYAKAMKVWKEKMIASQTANSQLIAEEVKKRGLLGLPETAERVENGNGSYMHVMRGEIPVTEEPADANVLFDSQWAAKLTELEKHLGVKPQGGAQDENVPEQGRFRVQILAGDLYEARLDMARLVLPAPEADAEQPSEEAPAKVVPPVLWRVLVLERIQPGVEVPERPVLKK